MSYTDSMSKVICHLHVSTSTALLYAAVKLGCVFTVFFKKLLGPLLHLKVEIFWQIYAHELWPNIISQYGKTHGSSVCIQA